MPNLMWAEPDVPKMSRVLTGPGANLIAELELNYVIMFSDWLKLVASLAMSNQNVLFHSREIT